MKQYILDFKITSITTNRVAVESNENHLIFYVACKKMNSQDCLLLVYLHIGAINTLKCRSVCKEWKSLIDLQPQSFWKEMYICRVGWDLSVSNAFNWQYTLVDIEKSLSQIEAFCTWNNARVKLMSPWKPSEKNVTENNFVQIGFDLISGVTRDEYVTIASCGSQLSYIYDDAFELKAIKKTCRRQNAALCKQCVYKQTCEKQIYQYFIKKLSHPRVNDFLCKRVTQCTSRTST